MLSVAIAAYALVFANLAENTTTEIRIDQSVQIVEDFFGTDYPQDFTRNIATSRPLFNAMFPAAWDMNETPCYVVGVGVGDAIYLLSPDRWAEEACEHNASNIEHVANLITHEAVHVFHGQHNPTRDFTGAEGLGWFIEGLAAYASGQYDDIRREQLAELSSLNNLPTRLDAVWSGPARYAQAGSLVAYIDQAYGRTTLLNLLPATMTENVLTVLGVTETELILAWTVWLQDHLESSD
jgi:hypothetical protein